MADNSEHCSYHQAQASRSRPPEESMTQANAPVIEKWERQRIRHVHRHKPVININKIDAEKLTRGQAIADRLATVMGSWPFIIVQSIILAMLDLAERRRVHQSLGSVPVHPAQPRVEFSGCVCRTDHHDVAEPASGEGPPDGRAGLRGESESRGRAEVDHDASRTAGRSDARRAAPDGGTASGDHGRSWRARRPTATPRQRKETPDIVDDARRVANLLVFLV